MQSEQSSTVSPFYITSLLQRIWLGYNHDFLRARKAQDGWDYEQLSGDISLLCDSVQDNKNGHAHLYHGNSQEIGYKYNHTIHPTNTMMVY